MRLRLLPILCATLVSFLVGGTALAGYRAAMGPLQCCASHCKHERKSADDAQRCCALHLGALQNAAKKESPAPVLATALVAAATPWARHHDLSDLVSRILATARTRAIPARSLLAQHTALQR